jgi:ribosomal protein L4
MRKNEYEEKLFKTEDERFEVDMLIDSTKTAVAALQKLQIEVDALALLASGDGGITLAAVDRDNSSGKSSIQPASSSTAFSSSVLSVTSPSNASSSSSDDVASTFRGYEVEELCGGGLKNAVHYKLDSTALNTVG